MIGRRGETLEIKFMYNSNSSSVYEIITERIVSKIEKEGVLPWQRPWKLSDEGAAFPRNLCSGKTYRGINCLMLYSSEFESPYWVTFKQCSGLGGAVKKGEKGMPVVFWDLIERKDIQVEDSKVRKIPIIKYSTVFNTDQCNGLNVPAVKWCDLTPDGMSERCKKLIQEYVNRPSIKAGSNRAVYSFSRDEILVPRVTQFNSAEDYFCTIFHELVHSTGHPKRLARIDAENVDSSDLFDRYGREELIAEIGASFLCAETGISAKTIDSSTAYLKGWLDSIKAFPKALIDAASQGQKACDLILGKLSNQVQPTEQIAA